MLMSSVKRKIRKLIPSKFLLPLFFFTKRRSFREGLPPGIDFLDFNQFYEEKFGQSLQTVYYAPISAWKSVGAYRLVIKSKNSQINSLVYKNASYSKEIIPALKGLPFVPGPPEFEIYKSASNKLTPYLPKIYECSEHVQETRFTYLMEDLLPAFRQVSVEADLQTIIDQLDGFHNALSHSLADYNEDKLLVYNTGNLIKLLDYAKYNLEVYFRETSNSEMKKVLDLWPKITELFLKSDFQDPSNIYLIHGDLNSSNVHLGMWKKNYFKVVDWEWAGLGLRHMDYVSLVKGRSPEIEKYALNLITRANSQLSAADNESLFYWCHLKRGLLDGSFLCKQQLEHNKLIEWFHPFISNSMSEVVYSVNKILWLN